MCFFCHSTNDRWYVYRVDCSCGKSINACSFCLGIEACSWCGHVMQEEDGVLLDWKSNTSTPSSASITEFVPEAVRRYLILMDLQYTMCNFNRVEDLQLRPYAAEVIQQVLAKRTEGMCQLGSYTSLPEAVARDAVLQLLKGATGIQKWTYKWPRLIHGTSEVWLFDDRFCERIGMTNLELVLSETETLMGNAFSRWSTVYITKNSLKNEASDRNMLMVKPWVDDLRDCVLKCWKNVAGNFLEETSGCTRSLVETTATHFWQYIDSMNLQCTSPAKKRWRDIARGHGAWARAQDRLWGSQLWRHNSWTRQDSRPLVFSRHKSQNRGETQRPRNEDASSLAFLKRAWRYRGLQKATCAPAQARGLWAMSPQRVWLDCGS